MRVQRPATLLLLTMLTSCGLSPEAAEPGLSLSPSVVDPEASTARAIAQSAEHLSPALAGRPALALHNLEVRRVEEDAELGLRHVRVQQTLNGVPVVHGEAIVHLFSDGSLRGLTDNLLDGVQVDTTPLVDEGDAIERAVGASIGWDTLTDDPETSLWVLRLDGVDHLAWKVQLRRIDGSEHTSMPLLWVDAHTGEVLRSYDNLHTAAGTGKTNYYGTVDIKITKPTSDTNFYLEDPARAIGTFTMNGGYSTAAYVYDADKVFDATSQKSAVEAHYAAAEVWDYYLYTHNWDGLDDAGGPGYVGSVTGTGTVISMFVNYGRRYANAFWDGSAMYFGDGDGTSLSALTTIDITGHEMTHGVTSYTAGFTYYGEPGALDEAYADIMGAMVERSALGESADTWMIGEDCYTPSTAGDAVRYMDDPGADGFTTSHYDDMYTGFEDSGGVHINAGVVNLAYYLLSEGGNHPDYGGTAMTGIGADDAADIAFRALKRYLTSGSDFMDARNAWLDSAQDLYGAMSPQYEAVMDAWALVGVGDGSSVSTCSGYDYTFSGVLPHSSGATYRFYPNSKGYTTTVKGTHEAALEGTTSANFDIFLQKYNTSTAKWDTVEKSKTASSSSEALSYIGAKGSYRLYVKSATSTGSFTACLTTP